MKTTFFLTLIVSCELVFSQEVKFDHILITNDDGIENADRLLALAKSVKRISKRVSIVVSAFDRSGTSNYTTFGKYQSTLEVTCEYRDENSNIAIYTMPGNPADCVLIGLNGLFADDKPDMVLSGINGGTNIGPGWFGSGTIGAIRMAAYLGVPGIALSGFDDEDERSFTVIPKWVTALLSTDLVNEISKGSYWTIGFPEVSMEDVKGVVVAERRVAFDDPEQLVFKKIDGEDPYTQENSTVWSLSNNLSLSEDPYEYDDIQLEKGYIVLTPMTIDENRASLFNSLVEKKDLIPKFTVGNE